MRKKVFVKRGFGLMEVVVAIGISMLALTSAALFSNSLLTRAQLNFYRHAGNQVQNLLNEQVSFLIFSLETNLLSLQGDGNEAYNDISIDTSGGTQVNLINSDTWEYLCTKVALEQAVTQFNPPRVLSWDLNTIDLSGIDSEEAIWDLHSDDGDDSLESSYEDFWGIDNTEIPRYFYGITESHLEDGKIAGIELKEDTNIFFWYLITSYFEDIDGLGDTLVTETVVAYISNLEDLEDFDTLEFTQRSVVRTPVNSICL